MKRGWRALAILAALGGLFLLIRLGWIYAQDRLGVWIKAEHQNAGWKWRIFGGQREGWHWFQADSIQAIGASATIRLHSIRLQWGFEANAYAIPAHVDLVVSRLSLTLSPTDSKDSSTPRFPSILQIPLRLGIQLDSMELAFKGPNDSVQPMLSVEGIKTRSLAPRTIELAVDRFDPQQVTLHAGIFAKADWTESDTLRANLSGLVSTGCCEQDSLKVQAALWKNDLRRGRFLLSTFIDNSRGWSEAFPALAKAPALHEIGIEAWAQTGNGRPRFGAKVQVSTDSLVFFPGMDFDITALVDSTEATLDLEASYLGKSTLSAAFQAPLPRMGPFWKTSAKGEIRLDRLGWFLQGFEHPLDGQMTVKRLDAKGAELTFHTDAGTLINGSAVWKGLHWNFDAQVAPAEPWAVGWVKGLSMLAPGSAHGNDSAGGALFRVTARQPRMAVVALDSLSTTLWIGPGPHLIFSQIVGSDSGRTWSGRGDIQIPDSLVRFNLHPTQDSLANIQLEAHTTGKVRINAQAFPIQGLPLRLPFAFPFDGRLDGELSHYPPIHIGKPVTWVSASLRAKPGLDSLHAQVEISIHDSSVQLPRLVVEVGGSRIEGSLATSQQELGWKLDTVRLGTEGFDLSKIVGLWPGLPTLNGRLHGYFLSQRNQGVSASARLESPQIMGKDKIIPLPDLLLWGERDTLHLGGWIPLGGSKSPFHLTATHLWEATPEFKLLGFWGDVIKLEAKGSFQDKKNLQTSFQVEGSTQIPGTEARLNDLMITGNFQGQKGEDGFQWNANARGERGVLTALKGNPLDLRFKAVADPQEIRLNQASLSGVKNGRFDAKGSWNFQSKAISLTGQARRFRLDLGPGQRLELDSLGLSATPDSRIHLKVRDAFWHQAFQGKGEVLDLGVSQANLVLVQAKDWKKLSGDLTVDKLLFTKNYAQVTELLHSMQQLVTNKHRASSGTSSSTPLILDLQATSYGDDIRISNNLGLAKLGFDLQVTGPTDAPLINGSVEASPDSGRFGYLSRTFSLDTLRLDWNTSPPLQGKFTLSGSRMVKKNCSEEQKTSLVDSASLCQLVISSRGTLDDPRLSALRTKDCAMDPSDDGTVGAFVALMTDCYPQPNNQAGTKWGNVVRDGTIDLAYIYGKGWFNEVLMKQLRGSKDDAIWLPDSVGLTEFPVGGVRDQLGLLALYHITPELDFAGVYRHTFTQSGTTTTNNTPVLSDAYVGSLKYRIPFWWIEEEEIRKRLTNRVFLQVDANQEFDQNSQRSTGFQYSLRYRWEFW